MSTPLAHVPERAAAAFPLTVPPLPTSDAAVTSEGLALLGMLTTACPAPLPRLITGMLAAMLLATVTMAPVLVFDAAAAAAAALLAFLAALMTAA